MKTLGIDLGTSTVKLAVLSSEGEADPVIERLWSATHYGLVLETLLEGLEELPSEGPLPVTVTGANSTMLRGLETAGTMTPPSSNL